MPEPRRLQHDVPLAPLTTIGIGGPARHFLRAESVADVIAAVEWAREQMLPLFILGGGSNLLISDAGFDGLVLQIDLRGTTIDDDGEFAVVRAAAGEPWDPFVAMTVAHALAGLECLSGIPGSAGATPIQNVGAYGQEVSETIAHVETFDRVGGTIVGFTNRECRFGYRSSLFKNVERERYIVLSVTFRLRRGGAATIKYPDVQRFLDERSIAAADLSGVREAVIAIRRKKGMVIDPNDPDTRSDGSFFMNPMIPAAELVPFLERARSHGGADVAIPHFPSGDQVKLSAAWLIEHAGFTKGFRLGNAGLSSKHTLAVINLGSATAADVVALVRLIQKRVEERFGITIHPEPNFVGIEDETA